MGAGGAPPPALPLWAPAGRRAAGLSVVPSILGVMAISKGDKVHWNTSQGQTTGKAVEKKTKEFTLDGQKFNASEDEPFWVVESEKSGSKAAHKESSLKKA